MFKIMLGEQNAKSWDGINGKLWFIQCFVMIKIIQGEQNAKIMGWDQLLIF